MKPSSEKDTDNPPKHLAFLEAFTQSISSLKRYWKVILGFVSRVSLIEQHREEKQIKNMKLYLSVVSEQIDIMKKMGFSDKEIQDQLSRLNAPLIQANLEAMIISRKLQYLKPGDKEKSSPELEDK